MNTIDTVNRAVVTMLFTMVLIGGSVVMAEQDPLKTQKTHKIKRIQIGRLSPAERRKLGSVRLNFFERKSRFIL